AALRAAHGTSAGRARKPPASRLEEVAFARRARVRGGRMGRLRHDGSGPRAWACRRAPAAGGGLAVRECRSAAWPALRLPRARTWKRASGFRRSAGKVRDRSRARRDPVARTRPRVASAGKGLPMASEYGGALGEAQFREDA